MSSACRHSPKIQNTHRNKKGFRISFGIGSVIAQDAGAPASATSIRDFINHDRQVQFWIRLYSLMNRIYLSFSSSWDATR
ncbi:hypothetical protein ACS0TY_031913 [Phlomoides rotata]